jgi:ribosomal protein L29
MEYQQIKAADEKTLRGRVKEIAEKHFKTRFSTEGVTPKKAGDMKKDRREVARIQTVIAGRKATARLEAEKKKLEERIAKLGKANPRDEDQRHLLKIARDRLKEVGRALRELAALKS